ncbi:MAG: hypothetical protein DMG89_16520 [Acidobacteria bacterium]|nr:MAG: hypothetical protein DMG89_16520 [Acidobacteriota bacterium]
MRRVAVTLLCFTLLALGFPSSARAQLGARTLPRSLDQLSEEAAIIVHGRVVSARIEPHPQLRNLTTIVVSMAVSDTYKGKPQKSFSFRQYVWDPRHAAVEYGKGQELVLLMGPVSEFGLSSPVGLEQGRFRVSRDQKGQTVAVNGRGNFGLFKGVEKRAQVRGMKLSVRTVGIVHQQKAGPLPLVDLENAIRSFAGTH